MDAEDTPETSKRVRSDRFGAGTVELDKGKTLIVRFEHGLEECERTSVVFTRGVADAIASPEWDSPLSVITRSLASAIRSVNDGWGVFSRSRIALLPHQLWVCRRVISSWPARWLVADDVGLGKTIEAGLILWPLLSKGLVHRLLIVCPASLVEQWQYRLRTMFDIRVARYVTEADTERSDFWATHSHVVGSLETLRLDRRGRHKRLLSSPSWDLLIVDEAHHINADEDAGPTLGYKLAQRMVEEKKVTSMIFFTGTPHRGKNFGFLALLQLLRPDLFNSRAPLSKQLPMLRDVVIRNNKQCVTDLHGRHLFQPPKVTSETYEYSPEETRFYGMLTEFILTGKAYASTLGASDQRLVILVLISMQKLASSSVAAIRRALHNRLGRLTAQRKQLDNARQTFDARMAEIGAEYSNLEDDGNDDELSRLEEKIVSLAAGVRLMEDEEPRLRELLLAADCITRETKIGKILALVKSSFVGRSVLFFTEYKATQSLLMSELLQCFGDGCVAFINGDGRADEVKGGDRDSRTIYQTREDAAELFNAGDVRFLISTEAGGEGIDLQEQCFTLVHVDLPWNPMRLHQRVGRLNRYGQRERVEVLTLRNPATVESRIWDKLNHKIENIMLAFEHVMEEPEDLLQLVLGMTSPTLIRDMFSAAPEVPEESLASWFNQKTATFGGRDVIATVKDIVGNCDRFDFQTVGKDVPPVDLPDLRPFLEAMLVQNRRRPKREDDGSLTFRTPDAWMDEVGVRSSYDGLIFDRDARGKEAVQRVVGVGHKALDCALRQAHSDPVVVACVSSAILKQPFVLMQVIDRVTGGGSPIRSVVVGAEFITQENAWRRLRDWEVVRTLNEILSNPAALRKATAPPSNRAYIETEVEKAVAFIESEIPSLDLGFKVPTAEVLSLLWPDAANTREPGGASRNQESG